MEHLKAAACVLYVLLYLTCKAQAQVNCTTSGVGRFADPNDATCKNYTLCVLNGSNNSFLSYNYVCPTTSVFNPTSRLCTTNYVCPQNTTTNTTTPTTEVCTSDSFIANPNVTDCSSYIVCVADNGTFDQSVETCPPGFFFNPNTTLCDQTYVCPTPTTTFTCTAAGRYPEPADTTCQSYYFCVAATNGTVLQYAYTCPGTSVFSPTTNLCTTNYVCPTAIG